MISTCRNLCQSFDTRQRSDWERKIRRRVVSLTLGYVSRTCGWTCVASVLTGDKMGDRHVLTVGLIQSCLAGIKACLFASVGGFNITESSRFS